MHNPWGEGSNDYISASSPTSLTPGAVAGPRRLSFLSYADLVNVEHAANTGFPATMSASGSTHSVANRGFGGHGSTSPDDGHGHTYTHGVGHGQAVGSGSGSDGGGGGLAAIEEGSRRRSVIALGGYPEEIEITRASARDTIKGATSEINSSSVMFENPWQ